METRGSVASFPDSHSFQLFVVLYATDNINGMGLGVGVLLKHN